METDSKAELEAFAADRVWVEENREQLLAVYAEQWIAVRDGEVIASDPAFGDLLRRIPEPSRTCVEFISAEPLEMIL